MTDAREIIARAAEDIVIQSGGVTYDEFASAFEKSLTAAGFRILGPDEGTVEYEIWTVGDAPELCASTTDLPDAEHYALIYGQDGPVEIIEVTRRALGREVTRPGGRTMSDARETMAVEVPAYDEIHIPSDIQEFGERHGIPTFGAATYRNGFMDGFRAARKK